MANKHMKKCLTSLIIKEMQSKTTMRYHLSWSEWLLSKNLQTNAREGVEKREPSHTVDGNANQYSHYGEQCGDSLKNWKQNCHMPISLLRIHTKETRTERDTCTPVFIAALFTIARTWKQPRCPSAYEWIRKLWYIYTMEYYSATKKNTFESVLMRWMKLEPIIQSEVSQKVKHQYSILTHIYGIQKDGNNNPVCETAKETQMYRTVFWTLWERERVV